MSAMRSVHSGSPQRSCHQQTFPIRSQCHNDRRSGQPSLCGLLHLEAECMSSSPRKFIACTAGESFMYSVVTYPSSCELADRSYHRSRPLSIPNRRHGILFTESSLAGVCGRPRAYSILLSSGSRLLRDHRQPGRESSSWV